MYSLTWALDVISAYQSTLVGDARFAATTDPVANTGSLKARRRMNTLQLS